ncbi:nitrous oxide reductase accessory protein NosL [Frigidibacter sp. RF13]|uniref:nitrous oxide reductase accessory protein NosL n=1 Tax=Frigidibacter sp. RF13 TaxID=2997340 RepID=UPI00226DFD57|nr:nitrous oxide reductase accessory protein NosL [Frigidibacter sp. RF13]MCY1128284.1 nitrous oxide reductase accessory protein NosL [Frigidibacter sp. RF13]
MKRLLLIALVALAACREEAQDVTPVALTEEAVGHYCQMNLMEHEGPKAQVHLDGVPGMPLFFSQVRDAIAYARLPEQDGVILAIYVNDMGAPGASWAEPGAENWIAADSAYYVTGSSAEGGMGAPELVPFADEAKAAAFAAERGGAVLRLADVPDSAVLAPVEVGESPATEAGDADYQARLKALSETVGE